jgi:hypothetical protein
LLQGAELAQLLLRANRRLGDNPNMGA